MTELASGGVEVDRLHITCAAQPSLSRCTCMCLGTGDPLTLARSGSATALGRSRTPVSSVSCPSGPRHPPPIDLDTTAIDQMLGAKGPNKRPALPVSAFPGRTDQ